VSKRSAKDARKDHLKDAESAVGTLKDHLIRHWRFFNETENNVARATF
jgi:hypothetical protein